MQEGLKKRGVDDVIGKFLITGSFSKKRIIEITHYVFLLKSLSQKRYKKLISFFFSISKLVENIFIKKAVVKQDTENNTKWIDNARLSDQPGKEKKNEANLLVVNKLEAEQELEKNKK